MAWTNDDLLKLEAAMKTGARVVEYATGKVEYRSLSEMNLLRSQMMRELGKAKPITAVTPKVSKGL